MKFCRLFILNILLKKKIRNASFYLYLLGCISLNKSYEASVMINKIMT